MNNQEELTKEIEDEVQKLYKFKKENNISLFGYINFNSHDLSMTYNTEKTVITCANELGHVKIDGFSMYTKSKNFICKTPFYKDSNLVGEYIKELKEIDGTLYQTDKIVSSNLELIEYLLEDDFVKENEEFYKIGTKDIEDSDTLEAISKEFKKSKTYKYISKNYTISDSTENTLDDLSKFINQKLIVLISFKKLKKKFLKSSKKKGFRRNNKKQ